MAQCAYSAFEYEYTHTNTHLYTHIHYNIHTCMSTASSSFPGFVENIMARGKLI